MCIQAKACLLLHAHAVHDLYISLFLRGCCWCHLQVNKMIRSFPDVLSHHNISATYSALAQDKVSGAVLDEVRLFLQKLLDLEAAHLEM